MSVDSEFLEGLTKFSNLLNQKLPQLKQQENEYKQTHRESLERIAPEWAKNIKSILFTEQMIAAKVREMADVISKGISTMNFESILNPFE